MIKINFKKGGVCAYSNALSTERIAALLTAAAAAVAIRLILGGGSKHGKKAGLRLPVLYRAARAAIGRAGVYGIKKSVEGQVESSRDKDSFGIEVISAIPVSSEEEAYEYVK